MKHLSPLLACLLLLSSFAALAQPAQRFLGGPGKDHVAQILPAPSGGFYAVGAKQSGPRLAAWLLRLDAVGSVVWEKTYPALAPNFDAYAHGLTLLSNGNLLMVGEQRDTLTFGTQTALAILTDANGTIVWKHSYAYTNAFFDAAPSGSGFLLAGWEDTSGSPSRGVATSVDATGIIQWKLPVEVHNQARVRRVFPTSDGKFLLVGRSNVIGAGFGGVFVRKIEPNGTQIWQKTFNTDFRERDYPGNTDGHYNMALGAVLQSNGDLWVVNPNGNSPDVALLHISPNGTLLEQKNYGNSNLYEQPYSLAALPDGGWLITGEAYVNAFPTRYQGFALCLGTGGLERWRLQYGDPAATDRLLAGVPTSDGRYLLAGMSDNPAGHGKRDGWLLRTDPDGNVLPWSVSGRIVVDLNSNCVADPGEPPAQSWFVAATDTSQRLLCTGPDGRFSFSTDDAAYTLTAFAPAPSAAWAFCGKTQSVVSSAANPAAEVLFLARPIDGGCPLTEVSVTQPDLVRCDTSKYLITVRNRGVGASSGLMLNLLLDPALSVVSASEPFGQNGQSLDFEVLPMQGFQEKIIEVQARLSCDVQLSATHTLVARLLPTACAPVWNGPRFSVEGRCESGAVRFSLKNEGGGGSSATARYRVMADDLLADDFADISLPEGAAAQVLSFPADGRTWRMELEQAPGFPAASRPSASVEGCGKGNNGLHSIALHNAWRFDDGSPEVCAVLAPNTTGVPNRVAEAVHGFGLYNFIGDRDWLEYTARARNPLSVNADEVEFRLSLSPNFDLRTFQPLAYNAPVRVNLDNNGVLSVVMSQAHLAAGEYAMLRFRVRPSAAAPPDSGQASLFLIYASAYFNKVGPYALIEGFHNFSKTFPLASDPYNSYTSEVLRFGGRSYDFGTSMATAPDGSVFLSGESSSYSDRSNVDAWLIKTDASGRAKWLTAIDLGDQATNTFRAVMPLPDGGCMAAGNYLPPGTTDNSISNYSAYAARMDAQGKLLWHKKLRPSGPNLGAQTYGLTPAGDGNAVVFGYCSTGPGGTDQYYVKMTPDGGVLWQRYDSINGSAFRPQKAVLTPDGSLVFMGSNESTVLNYDVFLEKIGPNGNKLWSKGYNSEHGIYLGLGAGLALTSDGGFMVSGFSQWPFDTSRYVITPTFVRFAPDGEVMWEKNPIIGPFDIAYSYGLTPAPGGGFFSCGEVFADTIDHFSDMMLLKIDDNAEPLWWRHYGAGNTEWAEDIVVSAAQEVLMWGFNQSRPPLYDLQGVLVRADLEGNPLVGLRPEPSVRAARAEVFPNPASSAVRVQVEGEASPALRWQLHDFTGQPVAGGLSRSSAFDIGVERLPAGVYVLSFPERDIAPSRVVVLH